MGSFAEGLVGLVLDGRYRLDALLGEGGMGAVFRATHLAMDRKVAIKLLKPHLSNNEVSLQRFAREARSTMKVDSPHAVKVLDYGVTPLRDYYMVLEYLDGRTVQRELDVDGVFAPRRVVHIARQALHALGAAHATGLVHRDIKPENILLMRVGADPDYTKVLDFGVAKLMEGAARSDQSQLALTQAGTVFGTPEFMSPEQACGHPIDGRSDLYSLGGTMFAMLTGCALFDGANAIEWLTHHVRTPPPHLVDGRPELVAYPELDELIQRCLAKQRDRRPRSAEELDELLGKLEPTLSRPPGAAPSPSSKVRVFSTSTFFEPLPRDTVDPGETLLALSPTRTSAETARASSTGGTPRTRRGLWLGIVALAVLGMISIAVGVVLTKRPRSQATASIDASISTSGSAADAPLLDAAPDAATDAPAVDAAVATVDAGAAPRPGGKNTAALEHLRNAEEGLRTNNLLKQLAEADLALAADPRNVRAKYLLGDALIKSGDLDRGCQTLRQLGRNPLARSRAHAAGCPGD
ncbi:MAG TPA: serine/threonine-protein kinase [Kofleriaceae bacterium]|nr:serine/threonine-protein kinase [Kofleriaceae bacterium]